MPNCKKCNEYFPFKLKIKGEIKNLQNRKYCLKCSPYKKHNTRKLEELENLRTLPNSDKHICKLCNREYIYDRYKGHRLTICNSCSANKKRRSVKQRCINYKGGKCIICRYNKCNSAMVFHHIDDAQKSFSINYGMSLGWEKIKTELDKCILLCNRCHAEVHDGIIIPPVA